MLKARLSHRAALRFILILLIAVVPLVWTLWLAHAANRTWTGDGGDDFWTTAANWSGGLGPPSAGDDLIFPTSRHADSVNKFTIGTTFNSLSVSGGHSMTGNSVSLNSGITAADAQIGLSSIKLNNNQTFNATTAGTGALITSAIDKNGKILALNGPGNFVIAGIISGAGNLNKSGTGTTVLTGNNLSFTGATLVFQGTLLVSGSQGNSNVAISGGTLGGSGTVGALTFGLLGGSISPGAANNGTGILTVNGNVSFPSAALGSFDVDLNSTTLGSGYDQLKVNGTVSLVSAANSALNVNLGFAPQPGATFTIIDNDGTDAVTQTFAGRPEGSSFTVNSTTLFVTYRGGDGNDVVLHVSSTRTWDGRKDDGTPSADNKWTTKENWVGDVAPQLGDELVFPAGAARLTNNNDFPDGTPFRSITITGSEYTLDGAAIRVSGSFTNNNSTITGTNTVNLVILSAAGLATSGGNSAAQLILSGNNTYAGVSSINSGTLTVNGNQPNSPINLIGGNLRGVGTVGHVTANSGSIIPSISSAPADLTLTVNGVDCSGGVFFPTFLGGPVGIQNTQLDVVGTLNLNQCGMGLSAINVFSIPAGTNYTIINNDLADPINGTFNNKPEGSVFPGIGGSSLGITYVGGEGGNDIVLHVPTTRTWDGGGTTNNWKEAANWEGDVAPGPGDDLIFPAGKPQTSNNNNFPAGTTFNSIAVNGNGYFIDGNAIRLSNGLIFNNSAGGSAIFDPAVTLTQAQTFLNSGVTSYILRGVLNLNGFPLTIDGPGVHDLTSRVIGAGGIIKNGAGTLTLLAGVNSYTGVTQINQGIVTVRLPNSLGATGAGNHTVVATGATLRLTNDVKDIPEAITLNGSGSSGVGALLASVCTQGCSISGAITLASNSSMNISSGNALTINGAIGDSGAERSLTKIGPGTLVLTAANTFTGNTFVNAGTFLVNGTIGSVQLTGGTLGGTGTVGAISGDGTVAPGASPGILTANGNVTFGASTTLNIEIGGTTVGTQYDRLNVTGEVALNGANLTGSLINSFTSAPGETFTIINKTSAGAVQGIFNSLPEGSLPTIGGATFRLTYAGGDGNDVVLTTVMGGSNVQFSHSITGAGEEELRAEITITRSGDSSGASSVSFRTSDAAGSQGCNVLNGAASSRCDYESSFSTVRFAPGETSKTIFVLLINDTYLEGTETFSVSLSNPAGTVLGSTSTATISLADNEMADGVNPIGGAGFFVRQHYLDFLNREPDPGGLAFWTKEITDCGNQQCIEVKQINVSAAFYVSIEFQETGYLVERLYKVAFGDGSATSTFGGTHQLPVPIVRLNEFLQDTQQIGLGFIVGQPGSVQVLENNKVTFTNEFVQRGRFTSAFPLTLTPAQFVDQLNTNSGNALSQSERDQLVNDLTAGTRTRAQVLRAVAEDADLSSAEFNRAFVLMQYFGYLRRDPNELPDSDYRGFDFWLTKLNQFNGNFVNAEMVKAFLDSDEYRRRFGP